MYNNHKPATRNGLNKYEGENIIDTQKGPPGGQMFIAKRTKFWYDSAGVAGVSLHLDFYKPANPPGL